GRRLGRGTCRRCVWRRRWGRPFRGTTVRGLLGRSGRRRGPPGAAGTPRSGCRSRCDRTGWSCRVLLVVDGEGGVESFPGLDTGRVLGRHALVDAVRDLFEPACLDVEHPVELVPVGPVGVVVLCLADASCPVGEGGDAGAEVGDFGGLGWAGVFGGWFDGLGCGVGPDVVDGVAVAACEEAAEASVWGAEDLGPGDGDADGEVCWGWCAHWAVSCSSWTRAWICAWRSGPDRCHMSRSSLRSVAAATCSAVGSTGGVGASSRGLTV